jgi:hypothetical protein
VERTAVHLQQSVKYGFHCVNFYEIHSRTEIVVTMCFTELYPDWIKIAGNTGKNSYTSLSEVRFQLYPFAQNSQYLCGI